MSEWHYVLVASLKVFLVALFAILYCIGGRRQKLWRRWVGGGVLGVGLNGFALWAGVWNVAYLLLIPAYIAALHLGYGGVRTSSKLYRRVVYGMGLGSCALLVSLLTGQVGLGGFQLLLAVGASVYLGVLNPVRATDEETLIAAFSVLVVPFMIQ